MNQLDRDLREALRPQQAPPGFADGLLAKTRRSEPFGIPRTWLAVAALVLFMIGGVGFVRQQRRQAEGEKAKQQLMAALRITGSKFRDVKERLAGIRQRTPASQSEN